MYVCVFVCLCMYVYVCMCVCECINMYVCVCVCVCMYMHLNTKQINGEFQNTLILVCYESRKTLHKTNKQTVFKYVYVHVNISEYVHICSSVHLSTCLSIHQSIYLCMSLPVLSSIFPCAGARYPINQLLICP